MKTGTKKFLYTIFALILALGLGIGDIIKYAECTGIDRNDAGN